MKLLLIFSLWSTFLTDHCGSYQEKIPTGFLKNTYSASAISGWFINPDSSFYAITLSDGYLTEVGKGKVISFKDSVLSFQYDSDFQIPNRLNLNYHSESRQNFRPVALCLLPQQAFG